MDIKTTNGTIASKIGSEKLAKVGDWITLYNRGNSLIDYVKAPFFSLTWIALLFEYLRNAFHWQLSPIIPIIIAVVIVPLSVFIALIDKKWLGIWKRQYYYELKHVNPYFEEQFDNMKLEINKINDKIKVLVEQLRELIKVIDKNN